MDFADTNRRFNLYLLSKIIFHLSGQVFPVIGQINNVPKIKAPVQDISEPEFGG